MKIFILEDDATRIDLFLEACRGADVTVAQSTDEAIDKWTGDYDIICLDHDLGGQVFVNSAHSNTGAGFARWMPENVQGDWSPAVVVHSYNPDGAQNIVNILRKKKYALLDKTPFGPIVLNFLRQEIERDRDSKIGVGL